jgi:hypothetical protein
MCEGMGQYFSPNTLLTGGPRTKGGANTWLSRAVESCKNALWGIALEGGYASREGLDGCM